MRRARRPAAAVERRARRPRASAVLPLNDHATGYPFACPQATRIGAARTEASRVLGASTLHGSTGADRTAVVGAGVTARNTLASHNVVDAVDHCLTAQLSPPLPLRARRPGPRRRLLRPPARGRFWAYRAEPADSSRRPSAGGNGRVNHSAFPAASAGIPRRPEMRRRRGGAGEGVAAGCRRRPRTPYGLLACSKMHCRMVTWNGLAAVNTYGPHFDGSATYWIGSVSWNPLEHTGRGSRRRAFPNCRRWRFIAMGSGTSTSRTSRRSTWTGSRHGARARAC
ncbi:hypothetical protein [Streptomyces sp. NPDC048590]|uniref:hypothetical protein n=1 Tax=Streptomyces sp. NPDC048590 TaxID=3365574 RepID=UPI00370FCCDE